LAGEQRASASEPGSSGFLRLIRCVISVGLAELLLMADEEAVAADAGEDEVLDAAPLLTAAAAAVDDEADAPSSVFALAPPLLLMGFI